MEYETMSYGRICDIFEEFLGCGITTEDENRESERAENFLSTWEMILPIHFGNGSGFSGSRISIHVPSRDAFRTSQLFYAETFHEIAHACQYYMNHGWVNTNRNTAQYAIDEISAELASLLLLSHFYGETPKEVLGNAQKYVEAWKLSLGNKDEDMRYAMRCAIELYDYALGAEEYQHGKPVAWGFEFRYQHRGTTHAPRGN